MQLMLRSSNHLIDFAAPGQFTRKLSFSLAGVMYYIGHSGHARARMTSNHSTALLGVASLRINKVDRGKTRVYYAISALILNIAGTKRRKNKILWYTI